MDKWIIESPTETTTEELELDYHDYCLERDKNETENH